MIAYMVRAVALTVLLFALSAGVSAQADPVPTLVPPTPIPRPLPPDTDALRAESNVARIQRDGVVRVGILYNEPPFGELNIQGDVVGFDASLARALAEAWGVDVTFVQVTRQNWIEMLQSGEIDLAIAARVHRREWDAQVEFSHTYRVGQQAVMVRSAGEGREDSNLLIDLVGKTVGVEIGTPTVDALGAWQAETQLVVDTQTFYTLDQGLAAFFAGEIDALAGRRTHLLRVAAGFLDQIHIMEQPLQREPYAIAMPRQDASLRNLVNRTLHYLAATDQLSQIYQDHLQGETVPDNILPVWANVGDEPPNPGQYSAEIAYPQQYALPRMQTSGTLRVAGVEVPGPEAPQGTQRVALLQRALLDQFAERWGVRLELIDGDSVTLLQTGQADLAVNVPLDWALADQVDFSQPYMLHGDRLMKPADRDYRGFGDLRGRWVGTLREDPGSRERAEAIIEDELGQITINYMETFEANAADQLLELENANAIYADSLRLIAHLEAYPTELDLTDRWYTRTYRAFALPPNDTDFRLLVDYTLQEITRDGTLATLLRPLLPPGTESPQFDYWPGPAEFAGIRLSF